MPFDKHLAAARNGSSYALGALLVSCRTYIAAVAERQTAPRLRGRVSPSSLVQEASLKAYLHFGTFRGRSERQFLGWLRQIMLQCLIDQLRLAANRATFVPLPDDLPDGGPPPDAWLAAVEQDAALARAINQLPKHYQAVIELHRFDRMTFAEAGATLGLTAEAARKVWVRAHIRLGQLMTRFA